MTAEVKVEAIQCPGFDAIDGTHKSCGELSRAYRTQPNIVLAGKAPCDRCRRQKAKYDEENGAKQKREAEAKVRHEGLIAAYVGALGGDHSWTMGNLGSILAAIDVLPPRSPWAPHDEERRVIDKLRPEVKLDIMRSLAGLPLLGGERIYR